MNVPFLTEEPIPLFPEKALYKADFLIMRRLDLEIDGDSHGTVHRAITDDRRDEVLKQLGYPTLRLTDEDTFHAETCAARILAEIEKLPVEVRMEALKPAGTYWKTHARGW